MRSAGPTSRLGFLALASMLTACGDSIAPAPPPPPQPAQTRSFAMGFAPGLPRPGTVAEVIEIIDSLVVVADATIIQQAVPWPELLAGVPMDSLVEDRSGLTDFLRARGLEIVFLVDPLDGLDRRREPFELVAAGRSLMEPAIRQMHEDWVRAIATRVQPEWFGLASEINTLAAQGDPALYAEILDLVNTLAPQIRARSPGTRVFVSFQADEANGAFGVPPIDHFALIDDFDIDALGLSSYPVFAFDTPADVPADYFMSFAAATSLPLIFVEGGWNSADTQLTNGTPQEQADWVSRYAQMLDDVDAELMVLLTFTDFDIPALGLPPDRAATLSNFAFMGIFDTELRRKAAYGAWVAWFERLRAP